MTEDEFKRAFHVYPTGLDVDDLAFEGENIDPGTTIERRRDLTIKECALCNAGQCVQVVQRNADWSVPLIVHSLGLN